MKNISALLEKKQEIKELVQKNYPRERIEVIKADHLACFEWRPVKKLPLCVLVADSNRAMERFPDYYDTETFLRFDIENLIDSLKAGSDFVPSQGLEWVGSGALATVFGSRLLFPQEKIRAASFAIAGAWVEAVLNSCDPAVIDQKITQRYRQKAFCATNSVIPYICESLEIYREYLPPEIEIITPPKIDPFTCAALLRGSGIYMDVYDKPEGLALLLKTLTDAFIALEEKYRNILGVSGPSVCRFGTYANGLRLSADSIINLSKEHLQKFILPCYTSIAKAFGAVYPHVCTTKTMQGHHLYEAFLADENVCAVSAQSGIAYYEQNAGTLHGRLAVESGYPGANAHNFFEDLTFCRKWLRAFIRKGYRTGILFTTVASNLEKARAIVEIWNEEWDRV